MTGLKDSSLSRYSGTKGQFLKIMAEVYPDLSDASLPDRVTTYLFHKVLIGDSKGKVLKGNTPALHLSHLRLISKLEHWPGEESIQTTSDTGALLDKLTRFLKRTYPSDESPRGPIRLCELAQMFQLLIPFADGGHNKETGLLPMLSFGILYYAALRVGELANLVCRDVSFNEDPPCAVLTIRNAKGEREGGIQKAVIARRSDCFDVVARLQAWVSGRAPDDYVIPLEKLAFGPSRRTRPSTEEAAANYASEVLQNQLQFWLRQAGVHLDEAKKYSPHSLRHGCATDMSANGMTVQSIMLHGRWKSDAYKRYLHATTDIVKQLAAIKPTASFTL